MNPSNDQRIPRRAFLKGAAGVLATTTSGGALAQAILGGGSTIGIAWWDGERLIPAQQLPAGSDELETISIALSGYGKGGIVSVDALFPIASDKGEPIVLPFTAWTPPPRGCFKSRFTQTPGPALALDVKTQSGLKQSTTQVRLVQGKAIGPRLREGTYVLAQGLPRWGSYRLDLAREDAPLRIVDGGPVPFQYLLVEIERV